MDESRTVFTPNGRTGYTLMGEWVGSIRPYAPWQVIGDFKVMLTLAPSFLSLVSFYYAFVSLSFEGFRYDRGWVSDVG